MRIKSTFYDYYDCVQATGQDQSLLYLRRPQEVQLHETPFPFTTALFRWGRAGFIHACYIVGFCGKIHPVLSVQNPFSDSTQSTLCFTVDEVDAFVRKGFKAKLAERYFSTIKRNYWSEAWHYTKRNTVATFFRKCLASCDKYEHVFQDNHCPVFLYCETRSEYVITYNGCLKGVQFYRRIEPFTAFQEIQMFLGGMAFPNKPIPQIDDKTMAEAKGFDKWSFRKEPKS